MLFLKRMAAMSELPKKLDFGRIPDFEDDTIVQDPQIMVNLVKMENQYIVKDNYFLTLQKNMTPEMRKHLLQWVLQVHLNEKCKADVFPLSVNIIDHFLAKAEVALQKLQLLAGVSIILAAKSRQEVEIPASKIRDYSCNTYSIQDINNFEFEVLKSMNFEVHCIIPNDFCEHIYYRLPDFHKIEDRVRSVVPFYIQHIILEFQFTALPPSLIAMGCIAAAIRIQKKRPSCLNVDNLVNLFHEMSKLEENAIRNCIDELGFFISSHIALEYVPTSEDLLCDESLESSSGTSTETEFGFFDLPPMEESIETM